MIRRRDVSRRQGDARLWQFRSKRSAIVNAVGPIRQVVQGADQLPRRYLVIVSGTEVIMELRPSRCKGSERVSLHSRKLARVRGFMVGATLALAL
jgi:hypothetical protein